MKINLTFCLLPFCLVSYCQSSSKIADSMFVKLMDYSTEFVYDMKYATSDNFLKAKVYDCSECYLRFETVKSLIKANKTALKKGFRIKLFDCYRPLDIQKKMWKIFPNPKYVANPAKGSIHNRGGALDLTLVEKNGEELDMGTAFDFFGVEAGHDYKKLTFNQINNRKILKSIMQSSNFNAIKSEWWHYNLKGSKSHKISNFKWNCN